MLPSLLSAQVQGGLEEFLRASFGSNAPGFDTMIERFLDDPESLTRGPYISLKLPFKPGASTHGRQYFSSIDLPWRPHAHQVRAFERIGHLPRRSTLVATGTGSGKTESFLLPILDACIQQHGKGGIKAILIYPMNALATDQAARLAKLVHDTPGARGKVRAGLFIGQDFADSGDEEGDDAMGEHSIITKRKTLLVDPPDILLTNYKMLDLLLLRPTYQELWSKNQPDTLQFLVVDELHTFDGAQGTDLACLIRRLKHRLNTPKGHLCCVGTSATMGGGDTSVPVGSEELVNPTDPSEKLREYAAQIFGEGFGEDSVVTEELESPSQFLSAADDTQHPRLQEVQDLNPEAHADMESYIDAALRCWCSVPVDRNTSTWRTDLGSQLLGHTFLHRMLEVLDGDTLELSEIVDRLRRTWHMYQRYTPEDMKMCVSSFLALISVARRALPQTAAQIKENVEANRSNPSRPLLQVSAQLWQRELRRMVASVQDKPTLAFYDDLTASQRKQHLPVVYCPHCSLMGWATKLSTGQRELSCDLRDFYTAFFRNDERIAFFFPHEAIKSKDLYAVNTNSLSFERVAPEDIEESELTNRLVVRKSYSIKGNTGDRSCDQTCPRCGAHEALTLLGSRAASLTSGHINELMSSRYNDHKKLLAFSDSVQDAAHRAGFFGARTWRFSMRTAIQRALQAHGPIALSQLAQHVSKYWQQALGVESSVAVFIPPRLETHPDYRTLLDKGELPASSALPGLVEQRLDWEVAQEYGLRSRLTGSLPRVAASVAFPDSSAIDRVVDELTIKLPNLIGFSTPPTRDQVDWFVCGVVIRMLEQGAIWAETLPDEYIDSLGKDTFVAFIKKAWLPKVGPRNKLPRLPVLGARSGSFDAVGGTKESNWWRRWFEQALIGSSRLASNDHVGVYQEVFRLLCEHDQLIHRDVDSSTVWGLDPEAMQVDIDVSVVVCQVCQRRTHLPAHYASRLDGSPCHVTTCSGTLAVSPVSPSHIGALHSRGEVVRVVTAEHTGLLKRKVREDIENSFKSGEEQTWQPNLLSCTPTLEMGIDIGDLSSAILCSVPPAQANYLQRIGRAGRRDGNALIITIAAGRAHDTYYFQDPSAMIDGQVRTPGIYLKASSVLERQLTAFCLDSWVKTKPPSAKSLDKHVAPIVRALGKQPPQGFLHDFFGYVKSSATTLLADFLDLFNPGDLPADVRSSLSDFIHGTGRYQSMGGLEFGFLDVFEQLDHDIKALGRQSKHLKTQIDKVLSPISGKPKVEKAIKAQRAGSYPNAKKIEAALKNVAGLSQQAKDNAIELIFEESAINDMISEVKKGHVLATLTNEGVLPNYAFPEHGIKLRSVIWRKAQNEGRKKYERTSYEYVRPAHQALSELAPNATFFAEGHQVTIDRVDMGTSSNLETWSFCRACSHVEKSKSLPAKCPSCGEPDWHQQAQMLRLRTVYASAPQNRSKIGDARDERQTRFYTRQLLVEVDPSSQTQGWCLDTNEVLFGVEYVSRVNLRDINFGERTDQGTAIRIAGEEERRSGFKVCQGCGTVQDPRVGTRVSRGGKQITVAESHTHGCSSKTIVDCLYLYREMTSEGLRILLPFLAGENTERSRHSFLAAFQMGLEDEVGGAIEHLRATIYTEPTPDREARKTFLMLYDAIPGGTGYLQELGRDPDKVLRVLERALQRLQLCECHHDPAKDGCYKCLYAHRNAYDQADISRDHAEELLTKILKHRQRVKTTESLGQVQVVGALDSQLEANFLEVFNRLEYKDQKCTFTRQIIGGRTGWRVRWKSGEDDSASDVIWDIHVHPRLGSKDGVVVWTEPDFIFEPVRIQHGNKHVSRRPVAVYLDGWTYHKEHIADDFLKRRAIREAGKHWVWSMDYHDVDHKLKGLTQLPHGFHAKWMPHAWKGMTEAFDKAGKQFSNVFGHAHTAKTSFDLLLEYLFTDVKEKTLGLRAKAYSKIIFELSQRRSTRSLSDQLSTCTFENHIELARRFSPIQHSETAYIHSDHLHTFVAKRETPKDVNLLDLLVVLDNRKGARNSPSLHREWRGFLGASNVLQFATNALFLACHEDKPFDAKHLQSLKLVNIPQTQAGPFKLDEELDDACTPFERALIEATWEHGHQMPELSHEVTDETSRVVGQVNAAWEDRKIAIGDGENARALEALEGDGWKVWREDDLKIDGGWDFGPVWDAF